MMSPESGLALTGVELLIISLEVHGILHRAHAEFLSPRQ